MKQSYNDVKNYLTLLDDVNKKYLFVAMSKAKEGEDVVVKQKYGTIKECYPFLVALNNELFNIFVTVNETERGRRRNIDIKNVRALFVELDHGEITDELIQQIITKYQCSFVVKSSTGKAHLYWRLAPNTCALEHFSKVQSLLQYKFRELLAGRESKDLCRILRLPGFYHHKAEPQLSSLVVGTKYCWESLDDLLDLLEIDDNLIKAADEAKYLPATAMQMLQNNPAVSDGAFVGTDSGDRNTLLFNFCYSTYFLKLGLSKEDALVLCKMHNKKNKPPLTDHEVETIVESSHRRFLENGGVSQVEDEITTRDIVVASSEDLEVVLQKKPFDYDYTIEDMKYPKSQLSIASRIAQRFSNIIKYNGARGFYIYKNGCWENGDHVTGQLYNLITTVVSSLEDEPQFRNCFVNDRMVFSNSAMRTSLTDLSSNSAYESVVRLLKTIVSIQEDVENFETDREGHLISCPQGILDLTDSTIIVDPNNSSRLVNRISVPFDPSAICPRWEKFIYDCMDKDIESVKYVQRVCGYLLSSNTNLKSLFMIYGIPGTGKSIFLNVMSKLLGPYAMELPPTVFMAKGMDLTSMSSLAQSQYCRMVTIMEVDEKDKWGKSIVKSLTGDDTITAKLMYKNTFRFKPRFKICIRANELPHADSLDQAVWERLKIIPFNVKFRGTATDDVNLESKLVEELSGILNWCAEGYRKVIELGIKTPHRVKNLTAVARTEVSNIDLFYDSALIKVDKYVTKLTDIYDSYVYWCSTLEYIPIDYPKFRKYITNMGNVQFGNRRGATIGIQVKEEFRKIDGLDVHAMI